MKSLRDQIVDLEDPPPADLDPESHDLYPDHEADSDGVNLRVGDGKTLPFDGREHYQEVAPSVLRRDDKVRLGGRYAGSAVSRQRLMDGEEDADPFAPVDVESGEEVYARRGGSSDSSRCSADTGSGSGSGFVSGGGKRVSEEADGGVDSSEAFDDGDGKGVQTLVNGQEKKGTEARRKQVKGKQRINGHDRAPERESEEESEPDPEDIDTADLSGSTPQEDEAVRNPAVGDRVALKALLFSSDSAAVASSLSAAATADAKKGQAVKTQYQSYDRLLDARIKLQKGLTAANSMTMPAGQVDISEHKDAIRTAEEAALNLWNTIISMRHSIAQAQNPTKKEENKKKRKQPSPASTSTPLSTLGSTGESISSSQLPHHRAILNKWSAKIRASNPSLSAETRPRQLGQNPASTDSITQVIDSYLATESDRLIQQSTSPLENPTSSASPPASHPHLESPLYDDTAFYHSLLRDLISSRSSSTTATTATAEFHPRPPSSQPGKKGQVDTKASKGRKLRYTVHEKLENFTAAQGDNYRGEYNRDDDDDDGNVGRSQLWASDPARTEFFSSLMGGRASAGPREHGRERRRGEGGGGGGGGDGDGDLKEFDEEEEEEEDLQTDLKLF